MYWFFECFMPQHKVSSSLKGHAHARTAHHSHCPSEESANDLNGPVMWKEVHTEMAYCQQNVRQCQRLNTPLLLVHEHTKVTSIIHKQMSMLIGGRTKK